MSKPITCVVNGNAYQLDISDENSLLSLSQADREQLLQLLSAINHSQTKREKRVEQVVDYAKAEAPHKPERMGEGDIDALMQRLILEEQQNKKPTSNKKYIYIAVAVVVMIALIVF